MKLEDSVDASGSLVVSSQPPTAESGTAAATVRGALEGALQGAASLMMLIDQVFHAKLQSFASETQAITDQVDARTEAINVLGAILQNLSNWGDSGNLEDQVQKTDTLILNGVSISESNYDYCKFQINSSGVPETVYAAFPPVVYEDLINEGKKPQNGQLVYIATSNSYKYFKDDKLLDVNSPLPLLTKTTPGDDFSGFKPGDLVFDQTRSKYYRVVNDGTGVEMKDYPLQKFIARPSTETINRLDSDTRIRLNTIQNLSKGDSLKVQEILGNSQSFFTAMSGLLTGLTSSLSRLIANIS